MTKREQALINEEVIAMLNKYNEVKQNVLQQGKRLRNCQAYVYETPSLYGYTSTSAQHIYKFSQDYGCGTFGCKEKLTYRLL